MNILIDASQFPLEKTGVGVYAVNLIRAIISADNRNRYTIVIQDDEQAFDDVCDSNARLLRYPAGVYRKFIFRFFLEQVVIPYLVLKQQIDVVHSLHYSFPLLVFGRKRVVTIHDMTFFKFPEAHVRLKVFYFRLFILLAAKLADFMITDSASTRRDFIARTGANPAAVKTIHLGRPSFTRSSEAAARESNVRKRLGISDNFILFVGTMEPRKNLFRLILSFARLLTDGKPYQLVILGKKGWGYHSVFRLIEELKIADHVIFTGYLNETDKLLLMKKATLFVYPSLYEGFGLPLLEALSSGVPAVTSNVSSLPEIAGESAILVDPYDTYAIYNAIKKLLSDEKLRARLTEKAKIQAKKFSWQTAALQTMKIYEAVTLKPHA